MEWKRGKCWKLRICEGKFRVFFVIWVKWKESVCAITLPYSSTFYSLFLPFFVLEIFKFKCDMFFVRYSASISKFELFEQPWGFISLQKACWIFSNLYIPPCIGKNFQLMVFTFLENALNLCIFTHAPVPHSKIQAEFFENLLPSDEKRGGNYDLLY